MITHLTEAARALRALFLNIVGDTKTEIEEGVTWTTGEIAGLKDVLRKYSPEAVKAAEATGRIIDPMEAIGGLAQSMKEGTLKEQELMEMVSDIGGKLRTSQLLALIQNWDMYKNMLNDTANAAGSADKEIANAMDSWTRKTNVLKNTWTEFIKSGLNSGQIKFFLDALTWIIKHLGTLNGAVIRLGAAWVALKLHSTASELTKISKGLIDVEKDASKAAQMMSKFGFSAKTLNGLSAVIGGLTLAWTAYTAIQAEIERKHQERVQAIYNEAEAAKESAGNVLDLYVEMDKAADSASDFTSQAKTLADTLGIDLAEGADKARQKIAELSAEELKRSADKANTAYLTSQDEYMRELGKTYWGNLQNLDNLQNLFMGGIPADLQEQIMGVYSGLPTITATYSDNRPGQSDGKVYTQEVIDTGSIEKALAYRKALQEIIDIRDEYIRQGGDQAVLDSKYFTSIEEYLGETSEAFSALEKARKDAIDTQAMELFQKAVTSSTVQSKEDLDELISRFQGARNVSEEVREKLVELANKYYDFSETAESAAASVKKETENLYENQRALEADANATDRAAAAKKDAEASARKFIGALIDENGELTENGIEAMKASSYLADLVNAEIAAQQEAQRANYANMRAQLAALAADAIKAAKAIMAAYAMSESLVSLKRYAIENGATPDVMRAITLLKSMESIENQINATTVAATSVAKYTSSYNPGSGSSGSSGSSGGGSGRTSGSSGGGKSSSSSASAEDKQLTALQNRVNLLKSELSLMQERGDSEEAQAAKMREIMAALKNEADYLKSIKGDQITINNLSQEWWSYNNKLAELMDKEAQAAQTQAEALQKAVDAQRALNNALKDRSVRYYNAQTGQWEWTANAENVANATKARDEAISAAGYDNLEAWNTYFKIASTMESIRAFTDFVNAHPSVSIWDIPELMRNSYTSNYGGTTNSNIYNFGGFTMSEQQAKGTTLYEMARRSRNLALHNSTY